ncbi:MAG: glycine oxidase ThiO [Acidobacteriota bacterium]|nr:MAG: glycine oxidase ThiO [Acidobacteriota bacterium]
MSEDQPVQSDAAVVGGGVIGCSIAWRLAQAGLRVILLDKGEFGAEASRAAGGMLAPLSEADETGDFFDLCVSSRAMYADFARELRAASGIDIEYRTEGTLYLSLREEDDEELDRRWQWQHAAGLNVKRLDAGCVRKLEPGINPALRWALKFPDDHQVNNRLLAAALLEAARRSGVNTLPMTEVFQVRTEPVAGTERVIGLTTPQGLIRAANVVVTAGCWSTLILPESSHALRVTPVRGQMVSFEMAEPTLNHVVYSRRGYLIPRHSGHIIAGSTTEHAGFDKSVTVGGIAEILEHAIEIMPSAGERALTETWAGLRPHSADSLPILGHDPRIEGLIHATAHYRNGILLTPITARAISELIVKGESSVNLAPFSFDRPTLRQTER